MKRCPSCYVLHTPDKCPLTTKTVSVQISSGCCGGMAHVHPGEIVKVANIDQSDLGEDALPISVLFARVGQYHGRAFGRVRFGRADLVTEIEVDVGPGCIIALPKGSCLVEVLVGTETNPNDDRPVAITGMIANYFSDQPENQPEKLTRTRYIDNLQVGDSITLSLPAFAQTTYCLASSGSSVRFDDKQFQIEQTWCSKLWFDFLDPGGNVVYASSDALDMKPTPLSNNIASVVVTNVGEYVADAVCVFELALSR